MCLTLGQAPPPVGGRFLSEEEDDDNPEGRYIDAQKQSLLQLEVIPKCRARLRSPRGQQAVRSFPL